MHFEVRHAILMKSAMSGRHLGSDGRAGRYEFITAAMSDDDKREDDGTATGVIVKAKPKTPAE